MGTRDSKERLKKNYKKCSFREGGGRVYERQNDTACVRACAMKSVEYVGV